MYKQHAGLLGYPEAAATACSCPRHSNFQLLAGQVDTPIFAVSEISGVTSYGLTGARTPSTSNFHFSGHFRAAQTLTWTPWLPIRKYITGL